MICENCGKSFGNEKVICPFCGASIQSHQVSQFLENKKDREKDLRPRLISERYGIQPISYELQKTQGSFPILIILGIVCALTILFLVFVFIFF